MLKQWIEQLLLAVLQEFPDWLHEQVFAKVSLAYVVAYTTLLGATLSPVVIWLETYIWFDVAYLLVLTALLVIDAVFHLWADYEAYGLGDYTWDRIYRRFILTLLLAIALNMVATYPVNGEPNVLFAWMVPVSRALIVGRLALSLFTNSSRLGVLHPPKWLLERLSDFNAQCQPRQTPPSHGH